MASETVEVDTPIYDQLFAEIWPPEAAQDQLSSSDGATSGDSDPDVTATPTAE